nr:response regulator [Lachnospiraceae bacterium]
LFTLILFIYGQFFVRNESLFANECELYDAVWSYTSPDGVTTEYRAPDVFDVKGVDEVRLTTQLPEVIKDGSCLFLWTNKDMDAYVEDDLRNSYRISHSVFGSNVKSMWLAITLRSSDAGKTLTLVRPGYGSDEYRLRETYIGNRLGFAMTLIQNNLFTLILGFSIIVISLVITLICLSYRIKNGRTLPLWYLSIGTLLGALWLLLDNYTYPLLFGNYYIDGVAEFLVLMLLPFLYATYVYTLLGRRYNRLYYPICLLIIVNFVTLSILHFAGIADFLKTMIFCNAIMGMVAVYTFAVIVYDTFVKGHRENTRIAVAFCTFAVLCFAEIIHVSLPIHHNDGVFISIGLLLILVAAFSYEVKRISELRAVSLEAQNANQAKSTFLANMSHEIRTPINAILGMDELILREDTDPKVREYAVNIKSAGTSLLEIISDVLDFSKIEQGKMEIINAEYDTKQLIGSIITMIGVKADENGLRFVKNISEEMPSKLIGDEKRIREVMINLLGNAVKYTPSGSITYTVRQESREGKRAVLYISVKDTGIGIKDSDKDKLFKQFERLDPTKTRSVEGSGLGLAIAANLIRLMGGTIECESTYGVGSEFIVRIPQTVSDGSPIGNIEEKPAQAAAAAAEDEPADLEGISALIVDDNDLNLKVASGLLRVLKVTLTTCGSGEEMLDLITKKKFDIILLDHMMPEMDGIEALEKSKTVEGNLNTDTPYIALTANAIAGAKEMYMEKGFSDYLSKPMTLDELAGVIRANVSGD